MPRRPAGRVRSCVQSECSGTPRPTPIARPSSPARCAVARKRIPWCGGAILSCAAIGYKPKSVLPACGDATGYVLGFRVSAGVMSIETVNTVNTVPDQTRAPAAGESVRAFDPKCMKVGVLTAALQELTPRAVRDADPDQA